MLYGEKKRKMIGLEIMQRIASVPVKFPGTPMKMLSLKKRD